MANVKEYYDKHLVSMEEAAKSIESGDTIWCGSTLVIPYAFLNVLSDRYEELKNVTVMGNLFLAPTKMMMEDKYADAFHVITMFGNAVERMAARSGHGNVDHWPVPYGKLVEAVTKVYKANVVCCEVCPMDEEDGTFNVSVLGTNFTPGVMQSPGITKRIAIVNSDLPLAYSDNESILKYKVEDFDYIVENPHPIPSLPVSPESEFDKAIAHNIIPYIHDGDYIQIGMGGLGDQIAKELMSFDHLGIFTEIGTDAMIELGEAGIIDGITMCGSFGTEKLYRWLGKRADLCHMVCTEEMLTPVGTAKQPNLVGINAALQIDLYGQMCAEAQGPIQYSGVGGAYAFVGGVPNAENGRSFVCLRSTHPGKDGQLKTNVHALLPEGSVVTNSRYLAQYLVTEYGVADVYLRTIKDRIKRIIPIAHPDFREGLKAKMIELGVISEADFGRDFEVTNR